MKVSAIIFIVNVILFEKTIAYRILGVFPAAVYSHYALGKRLMTALAEKGRDVTMIAPFKEKDAPKFYRQIELREAVEESEGIYWYNKATCVVRETVKNNLLGVELARGK